MSDVTVQNCILFKLVSKFMIAAARIVFITEKFASHCRFCFKKVNQDKPDCLAFFPSVHF